MAFRLSQSLSRQSLKIEAVNRLSAVGIPRLEVTSFVHPKAVPQLRDAEEVMARIARRPGTVYAALVPNDKGAKRAVDAGVDKIHTVLSASESHNLANVNMTVAESLTKLEAVAHVAHEAGIPLQGGISCSFGCPFEIDVPLQQSRSYRRTPGGLWFPGHWPGRYDGYGQSCPGTAHARIPDAQIPRH